MATLKRAARVSLKHIMSAHVSATLKRRRKAGGASGEEEEEENVRPMVSKSPPGAEGASASKEKSSCCPLLKEEDGGDGEEADRLVPSSGSTVTCAPTDEDVSPSAGTGYLTATSRVSPRWRSWWTPLHTTAIDINTVPAEDFVCVPVGKGVFGTVFRVLVVGDSAKAGDTGTLTSVAIRRMFDASRKETDGPPTPRPYYDTRLVIKVSRTTRSKDTVFERLRTAVNDVAVHRLAASQCPNAVPGIHAARLISPGFIVSVIAAMPMTLYDALTDKEEGGITRAPALMKAVAGAVGRLHSVGILHLDIKPRNILVRTKPAVVATLCDFGLAVRLDGVNCRQLVVGRRPQDRGVQGSFPDIVTPVFRPPRLHACHAAAGAASGKKFVSIIRELVVTGNTDAWCVGVIADAIARQMSGGIPDRAYVDAKADHEAILNNPAYSETESVGLRTPASVKLGSPNAPQREECAVMAACLLTLRPTARCDLTETARNPSRQYCRMLSSSYPLEEPTPTFLVDIHPPGGSTPTVTTTVPVPSLQEAAAYARAVDDAPTTTRQNRSYFLERLIHEGVTMKATARAVIVAMALTEAYGTWGSRDDNDSLGIGSRATSTLRLAVAMVQTLSPTEAFSRAFCSGMFPICALFVQKALETDPRPLLSAFPTADLWCTSHTGIATFLKRSLSRGSVVVDDLQAEVTACNLGQVATTTSPSRPGATDTGLKKAIRVVSETVM